jgi:hypothetical protein
MTYVSEFSIGHAARTASFDWVHWIVHCSTCRWIFAAMPTHSVRLCRCTICFNKDRLVLCSAGRAVSFSSRWKLEHMCHSAEYRSKPIAIQYCCVFGLWPIELTVYRPTCSWYYDFVYVTWLPLRMGACDWPRSWLWARCFSWGQVNGDEWLMCKITHTWIWRSGGLEF